MMLQITNSLPMAEPRAEISHAITAEVDAVMLQHIQDEFQYCMEISHINKGVQ